MADAAARYLEDHEPGRKMLTPSRMLLAGDIAAFAELSQDKLPIHTDPAYAQQSAFGGIIAHGTLVLAVAEGLMARSGMFDHAGAFLALTRHMRAPFRAGDRVHVEVVVRDHRISRSNPDCGIVEFEFHVINQSGQAVGDGTWIQQFAARPTGMAGKVEKTTNKI